MESTRKKLQAYHSPQVADYGNIKQLTMTISDSGRKDGDVTGRKKTGL